MKRLKFITGIVLSLVLAFTLFTPVSAFAEDEEEVGTPLPSLNDKTVYSIPKSISHHGWCVTYSNYYMLLRKSILLGSGQWDTIGPVELRSRTKHAKAYSFERDGVTYSVDVNWKTLKGMSTGAKGEYLKEMLKDHPEGIVIYGHHSQKDRDAHAVLLTSYDYDRGTFLVVDPVRNRSGKNVGIETIGSSTIGSLARITMFMHIKSYSGEVKTQMIEKLKPKHPLASEFNYPELMTEGSSYSIKGEVTSGNDMSEVKVEVLNKDGKAVQSKTVKPKSGSYDIGKLDGEIKFGELKEGEYTYKISATDKNGEETVLDKDFTVTNKSKMKIKDDNAPKTITKGKGYNIEGKVYSNYALKNVAVKVVNEKGKAVIGAKAKLANLYSYNLKSIDEKIKFSELDKGTYHYVVTARNKKGRETLVDKEFTVK